MMQRLLPWPSPLSLLAGCFTCLGCSSPPPDAPPAPRAAPQVGALDEYLPLRHDTIAQFETLLDGGAPGMFVLEISRPRPDLAELRIAGRVQRLYLEPGRVRHASGGSLLEEPLTVGHRFRGSFGEVTISEIDGSIQVPAGPYEHCLVTIEEAIQPPRRATSVYCKSVGLVALTVETFGDGAQLLENRLVQHGPRFK